MLARPLDGMTLLDIYRALGEPQLFAIGLSSDNPDCLVEQAVNQSLGDALSQARSALLTRLGQVTLGDLARQFDAKLRACRGHLPSDPSDG